MSSAKPLPDLLQRTTEEEGEVVFNHFANGLTIKTEIFFKRDGERILPLGSPQGSLMNHLLAFPEAIQHKRIFEPFAGSGALGFMALEAGAEHVDLLDINPRAADFQRDNASLNDFSPRQFDAITADIASFTPEQKYDLILANPPFVPTPDGVAGTLTSNGGPEGSLFVEILLERLEQLLEASGRALIYVFQFARNGKPLIFDALAAIAKQRPIEVTPTQARPISFEAYCQAYRKLFPQAATAIEDWRSSLVRAHGSDLELCHYVVDIGARTAAASECVLRDNFAEKFGEAFRVPSEKEDELAFGRVLENLVPPPLEA